MLRWLQLALCALLVTTTTVVAQVARTKFIYQQPGVGKGYGEFEHRGGAKWEEHGPRKETYHFREVERNRDFVRLYDETRKVTVWIHANEYKWKFDPPSSSEGGPLKGRWER